MNKKIIPILLGAGAIGTIAYFLLKKDYFAFENWNPTFDTIAISMSEEKTPSEKTSIKIENVATASSATYGTIMIAQREEWLGSKDLNANWSKYKYLDFWFYTPVPNAIQFQLGDVVSGPVQYGVGWNYGLLEGWNYVRIPLDIPLSITSGWIWDKSNIKEMRITIHTEDTDMINYIGDFKLIEGVTIPIPLIDDFEIEDSIYHWYVSGSNLFERSQEEVMQGNYSAKFVIQDSIKAGITKDYSKMGGLDMTPYENIHLDIWSSMDSKVTIIFTSENLLTEGMDYYSYLAILVPGWNTFDLTKADFGITREPRGWDQIDSVKLSWDWGGLPPEIVGSYYYIDNFVVS